ncbi:MAG: flagellar motor switch protein FliN [Chloroflexota bacterium]
MSQGTDFLIGDEEPQVGGEPTVQPVQFSALGEQVGKPAAIDNIDLILDVPLRMSVELGRTTMTIGEILALGPGSVIELDKLAGEPVDVVVNERLIARGEVVVVDENFGVRLTDIVSPAKRAMSLG